MKPPLLADGPADRRAGNNVHQAGNARRQPGGCQRLSALHTPTDEALAAEASRRPAGRDGALAELYRRHQPWILKVCRRYLPNLPDAEDAAQAIFCRVLGGLPFYQGRSSFKTWLYRIAVNVCLTHRTRQLQRQSREVGLLLFEGERFLPRRVDCPETATVRFGDCLQLLSPQDREILSLHLVSGLTFEEVARHLGLRASCTKMRYYRAVCRIRRAVLEEGSKACRSFTESGDRRPPRRAAGQ